MVILIGLYGYSIGTVFSAIIVGFWLGYLSKASSLNKGGGSNDKVDLFHLEQQPRSNEIRTFEVFYTDFNYSYEVCEHKDGSKSYTDEWYQLMVQNGETRSIDECNNDLNKTGLYDPDYTVRRYLNDLGLKPIINSRP